MVLILQGFFTLLANVRSRFAVCVSGFFLSHCFRWVIPSDCGLSGVSLCKFLPVYREHHLSVFLYRDQRQCRNGKDCQSSPTCFWSSLINLISKDSYVVFYLSCIISRFNGEKTAKQMKNRRSFVRTCWSRECVMTQIGEVI